MDYNFLLISNSVNHTNLIYFILGTNNLLDLPYYHYAFHYIIIALNLLTGISITKTILIFGQLLQVAVPITLFYPVYVVSKNYKAALITIFVAGFVWSMPSQATSWGKYPALLAMVSFVFVSYNIKYLIELKSRSTSQMVFLIIIIITAVFIHSRMSILIIIGVISLLLVKLINRKGMVDKPKPSYILVNYCLIIVFILIIQIVRIENWDLAFYPYKNILQIALILLTPL